MSSSLTPRERIIKLLKGEGVDRIPCFSGMGNVTTAGLKKLGYKFAEVHGDAEKMANLAATSHQLFDYECAVVPFDLCVEAEALGCVMNAYEDVNQLLYPTIKEKAVHAEEEMTTINIPADLAQRGRVPVVVEAIKKLKKELPDVAIGTYLLGPFTLAGQLMDLNDLFKLSFKKQDKVNQMLDNLANATIELAKVYREAGVDYICIREMGATTDILSPKVFRAVILPHLQKIFAAIDYPNNLHICGSTNSIMKIMMEAGADSISVETKNDMAKTRADIGDEPLIFGQVDAYNVLVNAKPEDVEKAVLASIEASVDAVWPSCDIWPEAPIDNLKAMTATVAKYGEKKWVRKSKKVS
jgi:[methyl-Co(III) methanol-specific corrinoid protein]:coenzyme M methyltransferase